MMLRGVLSGFALAACAWFALGARQAHELAHATSLVAGSTHLSATQASRAAALLRSASTLNPDRQIDVVRAELYAEEGRPAQARRLLWQVIGSEPENLEAWIWLARTARGDPATFRLAVDGVDHLVRAVSR